MPPMSQYDASSPSLWRCFASAPLPGAFSALPAHVDLDERNIAVNKWSRESESFDFTREDRVPDDEFNKVLWAAIKGEHASFPPINRAAFVQARTDDHDE